MKNLIYLILVVFYIQANAQVKHKIVITLDTKKMTNPDCSLGANGEGGTATVSKVYMHSGVCTCRLNETTLQRDCGTVAENRQYCQEQITPYQSNVWEHVVGNWGSNPQDDGVGLMTNVGNGVYSIEFIIEDYYSSSFVSTSGGTSGSSVVSSAMPAGSTAYVMGVVFRDEVGILTGRDSVECQDIFIVDLDTDNPVALNGSFPDYDYPFTPITLTNTILSIEDIEKLSRIGAFPNPMKNGTSIEFLIKQSSKNISIKIYNSIGQEVRDLFEGYKTQGAQKIYWNGKDNKGSDVTSGVYYYIISDNDKTVSSERLVVIR